MKKLLGYKLAVFALTVLLNVSLVEVARAQTPDPGVPGPLAVTRVEYNYGNTAFTPTGFPGSVELLASVHYPTGLPGGPYPLIVFLHGRHATCFKGSTASLAWPCKGQNQPIPSYTGYDYISEILASHGYIVVSISANGISAKDNQVTDLGMLARAELIQRHLDQWNTFNTTGAAPFGTQFVGKVNLNKIGTMGHSRGGEGVVRHSVFNAAQGSPYGIKAIFPLAPVDFNRPVVNNTALSVLLPYCDGDVNDLQGVHFFDDARYNVPGDTAPKHTVLVMGANHNFYNTVWTPGLFSAGTADDWTAFTSGGSTDQHCGTGTGNQRLTSAQQRGTGLAYITGFFRTYIGGESQFLPQLAGDAPPPPSAATNNLFVSYHAPDDPNLRRDINRLLTATNLTTNTLGGATSQVGMTPHDLCGGESPQPQHCLPSTQSTARQPHTTPSARSTKRGLSQLRSGWNALTAQYQNDLPTGSRNVSGFEALQFRVSVNFSDARNASNVAQNLSVVLTDGNGFTSSVRVSDVSQALYFPPGSVGPVPKVFLNTVRVPLSAFTGVNLTDIRSVQFKFDQNLQGALLVTDLAFASKPTSLTP